MPCSCRACPHPRAGQEVVRRGTVEVAIASGRRLEGVLGYVEALGIDCHIVPFNGLMCITSAARGATELYNMALPSEAVNGAMRTGVGALLGTLLPCSCVFGAPNASFPSRYRPPSK